LPVVASSWITLPFVAQAAVATKDRVATASISAACGRSRQPQHRHSTLIDDRASPSV
jgi:hypothetical protein